MDNQMIPFSYEGYQVRTVIVDNEPWFVAKDVCEVLDISWTGSQTLSRISNAHKGIRNFLTPGGNQKLWCIDEAGLYKLIMRSNKEEAERFQDWVTDEVLPTIRKTGSYSIQPITHTEALLQAVQILAQQEKQIKALEAAQETQAETIRNIKDALLPTDKEWRKRINEQLNRIAFACQDDFQGVREESYQLLEKRAACDLRRRVKNLRERLFEAGASKTKINNTCRLDVIEQDKRLKEIYDGIVRTMYVKYVA